LIFRDDFIAKLHLVKKINNLLLIGVCSLSLFSCTIPQIQAFLDNRCHEYVDQIFKFGHQDIYVRTASPSVHIGDTLFVKVKLNQNFYDSHSNKGVLVKEKLSLLLRLTTAARQNATSGSVFAIDTSIYNVFDQYFKTVVIIGQQKDKYRFDCVRRNGYWELDVRFVAKRKGTFDLYPAIMELETGAELPKGICMLGDPHFGAKLKIQGTNNRIAEIYPLYPEDQKILFGFYVE